VEVKIFFHRTAVRAGGTPWRQGSIAMIVYRMLAVLAALKLFTMEVYL
jgi:hypothetical protein